VISEKTVELNLTADLVYVLQVATGHTYYAVGLTQQQESALAYDVAIKSALPPLLVQFKRAETRQRFLRWTLNQTRLRDQHLRLQRLESVGLAVVYAFPLFADEQALRVPRPDLLSATAFVRPSAIRPVGGSTGTHHVRRDMVSGRWTVHSPEGEELSSPMDFMGVYRYMQALNDRRRRISPEALIATLEEATATETAARRPRGTEWRSGQTLLLPGPRSAMLAEAPAAGNARSGGDE
jgi:hypothetical protein